VKQLILVFSLSLFSAGAWAQGMYRPSESEIATLPAWAQAMYGQSPNMWQVDSLFKSYYRSHTFSKSYHTQYYKRWKRKMVPYVKADGSIVQPTAQEYHRLNAAYEAKQSGQRASNWSLVGPIQVLSNSGNPGNDQSNIYSVDQCAASPNIMYCGSETGEVYRSNDGGASWFNVSYQMNFGSGVTAVEVHPTNGETVFVGGNSSSGVGHTGNDATVPHSLNEIAYEILLKRHMDLGKTLSQLNDLETEYPVGRHVLLNGHTDKVPFLLIRIEDESRHGLRRSREMNPS
jgi:hypothetical protein